MDVQHWRARSSVIVTGVDTVLCDDPYLTVRPDRLGPKWLAHHSGQSIRQPQRVILDTNLRIDLNKRLLRQGNVQLVTACQDSDKLATLHTLGVMTTVLPRKQGRIDLQVLVHRLAEQGANEVWVEAGSTLAGSWIQQGLVDELILYMAPHLMGHEAHPLFKLPGLQTMRDRVTWQYKDVQRIGDDIRLVLTPI